MGVCDIVGWGVAADVVGYSALELLRILSLEDPLFIAAWLGMQFQVSTLNETGSHKTASLRFETSNYM